MEELRRSGYFWENYGFTKTHYYSSFFTCSVFGAIGIVALILLPICWLKASDVFLLQLILLSIACFAGAIATAAVSIFTLTFFQGQEQIDSQNSGE